MTPSLGRAAGLEYLLVDVAVLALPRGHRDRYRREWYSTLDELHAEQQPVLRFALTSVLNGVRMRGSVRRRVQHMCLNMWCLDYCHYTSRCPQQRSEIVVVRQP
ncbi:hypothetical protein [Nocardia gipuzkoensis]|uniref:hypothetical protein n=1 Tax=Nocardia gipuzkoensis TaxID=2749991 RepID=UPI00237EE20E|nr:hypothetical protein [Nocardia gipuzkoensis]MDE1674366.1 hypothetical protein [Nocardia gipuzkoensis]